MVSFREAQKPARLAFFLAGAAFFIGMGMGVRKALTPVLGKKMSLLGGMGVPLSFFARKAHLVYQIYGPTEVKHKGNKAHLPTQNSVQELLIQGTPEYRRIYLDAEKNTYKVNEQEEIVGKGKVKTVRLAHGSSGQKFVELPINGEEAQVLLFKNPKALVFKAPPSLKSEYVAIEPNGEGDLSSPKLELQTPGDYKKLMRQVAEEVLQLHELTVNGAPATHRDLKPANILWDKEGNYHLTDFGWVHGHRKYIGGSPHYLPPEARLHLGRLFCLGNYDQKSEVYALGILFLQVLMGRREQKAPFPNMGKGLTYLHNYSKMTERDLFNYVDDLKSDFNGFKPILKKMLAFDRDKRVDLGQALKEIKSINI
ncbi:MAG: hypothetical protein JSR80_07890 [Verrucomicrobia bacterium]|nr:hypothetical protein [Verrucomicrobiota bacterium]